MRAADKNLRKSIYGMDLFELNLRSSKYKKNNNLSSYISTHIYDILQITCCSGWSRSLLSWMTTTPHDNRNRAKKRVCEMGEIGGSRKLERVPHP